MPEDSADLLPSIARALRSPFVPVVFERLAQCGGYLEAVWPQLAPSVETAGFRDSALYLADMALDAAEAELEPGRTREVLISAGFDAHTLEAIVTRLDVFQWVTPQTLLILAALVEAVEQPRVGGGGRPEARVTSPRETAHLATPIALAVADTPPLPAIATALQLAEAPEPYRAVASPGGQAYLDVAWDETQHLASLPELRRRGRALYYYARSATRFLAYPLTADAAALAAAGVAPADFEAARALVGDALPAAATTLMHVAALRVGLGITAREVVARP